MVVEGSLAHTGILAYFGHPSRVVSILREKLLGSIE
jgi:hypothetical protein